MKRIGLIVIFALLISCAVKQAPKPLTVIGSEKGLELHPAEFSELKNFAVDDLRQIKEPFVRNCAAIKTNPEILQKSKIKINVHQYLQICQRFTKENLQTTEQIRQFMEKNFRPYLVMYNLQPEGRFTSYYEAELKASRKQGGVYQYPIYGRPNDLIEINLQSFDKSLPNRRLLGRVSQGKAVPYYTRAEIERFGIDAPVILWGDDPVDIYLMQIQGSAVAVLDDGSVLRIRYADNNGHQFIGIGGILLKKGLLKPGEASMDKIRDWLKANPQIGKINMAENPRFIFHGISDAAGPVGALGVPLTPGRSLAVDQTMIPLGSLIWLETTGPRQEPIEKLVAAQDIGGAIKGAVRGDYFWGHGEQALLSAGKMNAAGRYYILLPRSSEVKID